MTPLRAIAAALDAEHALCVGMAGDPATPEAERPSWRRKADAAVEQARALAAAIALVEACDVLDARDYGLGTPTAVGIIERARAAR